jgi:hypothetical protein
VSKTSQPTLTSKPPAPPSSGGNLKYVLIGLLFLGAAIALWLVAGGGQKPPVAGPAPAPEVQRVNPMEQPDLQLEEPEPVPEPVPEPEPEPTAKPKGRAAGEWECSGDLPNPGKVINDNHAQIRSCYERRLKVNNVLQGDLMLRVKVGPTGRVVASSATGSIRDPQVFSCVRALAQNWNFPVPTGGGCAVVQVPFQFSPKNP